MRLVLFTEIVMRQTQNQQIQVVAMPRKVVAEHVTSIGYDFIPSEVAGPGGSPVMKEVAAVYIPGEKITVDCSVEKAEEKIRKEDAEGGWKPVKNKIQS